MRQHAYLIVGLCALIVGFPLQASSLKLGIICALPKELGALADEMKNPQPSKALGKRQYLRGELWGIDTVLVTSRVGKVAAATTATHLIESDQVDAIIYLGVAGAIANELHQGDIVVGERLLQYDMDSRPLASQFTVPLINVSEFEANPTLTALGQQAAQEYLQTRPSKGKISNKVHKGLIGTGDRFISGEADRNQLREALPALLAVDMEGAAVAQVCYEHELPFVVIRAISDGCDQEAAVNCMQFLQEVAPTYTREVLQRIYQKLPAIPKEQLLIGQN